MKRRVVLKNLTVELYYSESPSEIKGRGWAHTAEVVGYASHSQLSKLVGVELLGQTILAIEAFAVEDQSNKVFSILVSGKIW